MFSFFSLYFVWHFSLHMPCENRAYMCIRWRYSRVEQREKWDQAKKGERKKASGLFVFCTQDYVVMEQIFVSAAKNKKSEKKS